MDEIGISYRRAWQLFKEGKLPNAYRLLIGTIIVEEDTIYSGQEKEKIIAAIYYCRVSSAENKDNLERQAERLKEFAMAKGYKIQHIIKEIDSGVNDARPKLINLFRKRDYNVLLVEHKDRLTRFGFNYIC
ncbi:MAG: IS607 family transposase [Candidatus Aenigmatarchaeota archaeon]